MQETVRTFAQTLWYLMVKDLALFIHPLNKFTESLLCARHCSSTGDIAVNKTNKSLP